MFVSSVFHAKWDSTNNHLRTPIEKTSDKIKKFIWNLISILIPVIGLIRLLGYLGGKIARLTVLPATSSFSDSEIKKADTRFQNFWSDSSGANENFSFESHKVITPDGMHLGVKLLRHKEATQETPTLISFNGNGALAGGNPFPWFLDGLSRETTPYNVVLFDYRGVGQSKKGVFRASKDLIVDGSSIVQWVQKSLKTPKDRIHFYGHSLGGAIAAQTKALDKELTGVHINDRSFASTDQMTQRVFKWKWMHKLAAWIVNSQGYGIDAVKAFEKLQGKKVIVYHPRDPVIPFHQSLYNHTKEVETICLSGREFRGWKYHNHHCTCLSMYEGVVEALKEELSLSLRIQRVAQAS